LEELQHYPETWAGLELTPFQAYGFRLYRNNSQLHMHVDKSQTHVISFILHIDSSEDAEPWPILIEDFHGSKWEFKFVKKKKTEMVAILTVHTFALVFRHPRGHLDEW
jgi:hypothetical protein